MGVGGREGPVKTKAMDYTIHTNANVHFCNTIKYQDICTLYNVHVLGPINYHKTDVHKTSAAVLIKKLDFFSLE